ncbi:ATPase H+ transporting accessory protein 1 like a [Alosa alosa]|uniref:ATPase H+ transporting accessory protein 1 like a n=1 Tax=Alosa sapidissima TaxID=34773 RepID=UPI001C09F347|nr:ATPase H+ transporting accessory protein 1 like a [Alosa sapidissima]XP_048109770.1 ATPase H+ transporting accessory protein 1 like a [Alosa alosa]
MAQQRILTCFILFLFIFFSLTSSYSQVPATVQRSLDASSPQTSNVGNDGVASHGTKASKGESTSLAAENSPKNVLQPYGWWLYSPLHTKRKLLQAPGSILPYSPLNVVYNGKMCILFRARKLAIRYKNSTLVDLTERAFGPEAQVDTKGSFCSKDKATLIMRFGDVEDLRGLAIRLQMSNTFYESAGQNWFTLDSVHIHYNWTHEATFNASDVYAPSTNSYHCQHVSSLQKYDTLLVPSSNTDNAANWHITFTDFQIQAFNVLSNKFASPSDCATFFTPAILMGLITSLILLLVLAYALHMVVHLKHIDRYEEHKTTVYFPRSTEAECTEKNNL